MRYWSRLIHLYFYIILTCALTFSNGRKTWQQFYGEELDALRNTNSADLPGKLNRFFKINSEQNFIMDPTELDPLQPFCGYRNSPYKEFGVKMTASTEEITANYQRIVAELQYFHIDEVAKVHLDFLAGPYAALTKFRSEYDGCLMKRRQLGFIEPDFELTLITGSLRYIKWFQVTLKVITLCAKGDAKFWEYVSDFLWFSLRYILPSLTFGWIVWRLCFQRTTPPQPSMVVNITGPPSSLAANMSQLLSEIVLQKRQSENGGHFVVPSPFPNDADMSAAVTIIPQLSQREADDSLNCRICKRAFVTDELDCCRISSCAHIFHETCLNIWLHEMSAMCPACGQDLSISMLRRREQVARARMAYLNH